MISDSNNLCRSITSTKKKVELYAEAAELGLTEALFNLGVAYESGDGV